MFNQIRSDAELTLSWQDFGLFLRGYGFYDYETEEGDREHRPLGGAAKELIGSDIDLQENFISYRTSPDSPLAPTNLRLGRQVVNWGESSFLNGINVINPLNVALASQPTARPGDVQRRQGMLWGVLQLGERFSVEAFYQYEWRKTLGSPWGSFFSAGDSAAPGSRFAQTGEGKFSDLGTDRDALYGLPPGTLGFDPEYQQTRRISDDDPRDGGQFGFSLQGFLPQWNDMAIGAYFINYHSRLPAATIVNADQAALDGLTPDALREAAEALLQQPASPRKPQPPSARPSISLLSREVFSSPFPKTSRCWA